VRFTSGDFSALTQDLTSRYALGPLLGRGASGAVHRAQDVAAGREVAIKLLDLERTEVAVTRFLREANVVAALDHPGVIKVHAAGRHGGRPAIVYELVEGSTFSTASRTLAPRARAELVRDAARAVGYAHARGVVHRDLKPDNLLVGHDGRVHVADFGLARFQGADRLTRTGGFVGTPHYMAPETFESRADVEPGPAADVWALGVILYEALTGRLPFDAPDLVALVAQLEGSRLLPPRKIDPQVDRALEAVCLRALERGAARRYPDGEALAQALDDALAGRAAPGDGRALRVGAAAAGVALIGLVAALALRAPAASPAPTVEPSSAAPATETPATEAPPSLPPPTDEPITDRQLLRADTPRWAVWADARRVVTGGPDDAIRVLDAATGQELRAWPRATTAAARLGPGRVIVGSDTGLHLVTTDGDEAPTSFARFASVTRIACAATSKHVAVIARGVDDSTTGVHVVDPDGQTRRAAPLPDDVGTPVSLAVSADGAALALGTKRGDAGEAALFGSGGPVLLFSMASRPTLRHSTLIPGFAAALAATADGQTTLVGTTSAQIGLIVNSSGAVMDHFLSEATPERAHHGVVRALVLSADEARLFSVAAVPEGFELKVWDYPKRKQVGAALTGPGDPLTLDVSPDGRALVIGTAADGVHVRALGD
jgi:hypothetical protein